MARHRVHQRCLARAGAARNQDIDPATRRKIEELCHLLRQVALANHCVEREILLGKFADRNRAAIQTQWWYNDVDTTAIGETSIHQWTGLVNTTPNGSSNALRDMDYMLGIPKPGIGLFQLAGAFDIDVIGSVDQDIGNPVILKQRFQRAETDHIIGQLNGEGSFLGLVKLDLFLSRYGADQECDLRSQPRAWNAPGNRRVDPRHQRRANSVFEIVARA